MGLETDLVYGQTGSADSNIVPAGAAATTAVTTNLGTTGSFDINTDVRAVLELKWLYTEFEVPLIPVPTVVRLGAQPFGSAANYKLAAYATGDFAGVNVVSTITPNVKLVASYVAVEENLVGRSGGPQFGIPLNQLRGDDWAVIAAPEITPFKGLDIKPMYSYFYASGTTNAGARQGRGGINTSTAYTAAGWHVAERHQREPSHGGRGRAAPHGPLLARPDRPVSVRPSRRRRSGRHSRRGVLARAPGSVARADLDAWLLDVRAGYPARPAAPGSDVHVHDR